MSDLTKRAIAVILGLVLTFTFAACGDDDGPSDTTSPGGSSTTEPVGS